MKEELKKIHFDLVKKGDYYTAKNILDFMRDGKIILGLGDADFKASILLDDAGFWSWINPRVWTMHFKMQKRKDD